MSEELSVAQDSLLIQNVLIQNSKIMKKTYLIPAMQMEEAQAAQMIADSLKVNKDSGKTVDGEKTLTKEDNAWDIWGEE